MNNMPRYLFPRINKVHAEKIWAEIRDKSIPQLEKISGFTCDFAFYSETGGTKVNIDVLKTIQDGISKLATQNGYPGEVSKKQLTDFDTKCAAYLVKNSSMPVGEALRNETWMFFTLVLLPNLCRWRFPLKKRHDDNIDDRKSRFFGGTRNTFQRLWRRGFLMTADGGNDKDLELLRVLTEDAQVAIFERPGISSSPKVARALALGWKSTSEKIGREKMEPVHRETFKRIRAWAPVISFECLPETDLKETIDKVFSDFKPKETVRKVSSDLNVSWKKTW